MAALLLLAVTIWTVVLIRVLAASDTLADRTLVTCHIEGHPLPGWSAGCPTPVALYAIRPRPHLPRLTGPTGE